MAALGLLKSAAFHLSGLQEKDFLSLQVSSYQPSTAETTHLVFLSPCS